MLNETNLLSPLLSIPAPSIGRKYKNNVINVQITLMIIVLNFFPVIMQLSFKSILIVSKLKQ